jgi:hypothetical protein
MRVVEVRQLGALPLCSRSEFVYVAIYWNNHHHLLHTMKRVDALMLWANSYLLFSTVDRLISKLPVGVLT